MNLEQFNERLRSYGVRVYFSRLAERDFKSFSAGKKNQVLLLILKQAQKGAEIKPRGNGNQLNPPLHQFAKIKSKAISLRVVYRPVSKGDVIEMQVIAIGPRDKNKVYHDAQERMISFFEEMDNKY
jgi:mRNA interferase RelE/StbE